MAKETKNVGRPGRKITSENYVFVMRYFSRDSFRSKSVASNLLRQLALDNKDKLTRLHAPDAIDKYISSMQELLSHHIKSDSPKDMIQRFEDRVAAGLRRIPITESNLDDLHKYAKELTPDEWRRCSDWVRHKRKRELDKSTKAEKRTIKVSTPIFRDLNRFKSSMSDMTWDEVFTFMLEKCQQKS
jgi:GTPase SAR1 family protein